MADGVLRKDEHGAEVKALQERLNALGYTDANGQALGTDGKFGDRTHQAVQAFQRDHQLSDDGIAGHDTSKVLATAQPRQPDRATTTPHQRNETSRPLLLSDQGHPQYAMYQQAVGALEKLGPRWFHGPQGAGADRRHACAGRQPQRADPHRPRHSQQGR